MVATLRSWRLRWRLWLVWLLTGHPRFKPIYMADVVSYDPLKQAEHLADAGYLIAAAMLARGTVENRIKRVSLISPNWRSLRAGRVKFCHYVGFLKEQGLLLPDRASKADKFYALASELSHGQGITPGRCEKVLSTARGLSRDLSHITRQLLSCQEANAACKAAVRTPNDVAAALAGEAPA